jgi:Transposase DDE domain group 1
VVGFPPPKPEREQYLVAAVLRAGNVTAAAGAVGILRRLIARVKEAFPDAKIRVRLDGGFAAPEVLGFLDCEPKVEYIVNLAANAVLKRKAEAAMKRARRAAQASGQTEHVYGECLYRTRTSWPWKRRVIYKAEVVRAEGKQPKENPRFVVTNMKQSPQWIYEQVYCPRGDLENRIKELHDGMEIGRTSCTDFWANQFRVLMTAAAYVLMQELRLGLAGTASAQAQVATLRTRFLKIGAEVVASVRRIVLHLPRTFPYLETFHRLALNLGAQSG